MRCDRFEEVDARGGFIVADSVSAVVDGVHFRRERVRQFVEGVEVAQDVVVPRLHRSRDGAALNVVAYRDARFVARLLELQRDAFGHFARPCRRVVVVGLRNLVFRGNQPRFAEHVARRQVPVVVERERGVLRLLHEAGFGPADASDRFRRNESEPLRDMHGAAFVANDVDSLAFADDIAFKDEIEGVVGSLFDARVKPLLRFVENRVAVFVRYSVDAVDLVPDRFERIRLGDVDAHLRRIVRHAELRDDRTLDIDDGDHVEVVGCERHLISGRGGRQCRGDVHRTEARRKETLDIGDA